MEKVSCGLATLFEEFTSDGADQIRTAREQERLALEGAQAESEFDLVQRRRAFGVATHSLQAFSGRPGVVAHENGTGDIQLGNDEVALSVR